MPTEPADVNDRDEIVAGCLEDFHRRAAMGERPMPEDFADRAGGAYPDFLAVLAAEQAIDDVIEPVADGLFPRPFGDYTLLRELGRGAVGVVFEAVHRRLGRKVALKVLKHGFESDRAALERFRREARALAQVKHDHIVDVYEAGEVDGRPYYAMELLAGVSLWRMKKDGRLPDARALCAGLAGVAEALATLHEAGIVHRDVKPSNLMVRTDGRMLLADFGLARTATSEALTQTGEALGTPLYMSPEQVLGKRGGVDGRTDVYALGATLYELLGGRPPCRGEDVSATLRMILTVRPAPLHEVAPGVPADAESIVMKALEKRPEDRYASAADMAADLRAFAAGRPVSGRPVSALERASRSARRFALPIGAAAAVFAAVGLWLALRPPTPAQLEVASHPCAEVFVDDVSFGHTPVVSEIPPGPHKIALRLPGFADAVSDVTLKPGQVYTREFGLAASDCDDPKAIEALASDLDLQIERAAPAQVVPGGFVAPVAEPPKFVPLFPRGKVRPEDLDTMRVEVATGFVTGGKIEFRRRGEVVGTVDFFPATLVSDVPIPEAIRTRFEPGDVVTWGWVPAGGGDPVMSEFRVAPDLLGPKMREVETKFAVQMPVVRHVLKARALLKSNLCVAAWREAEAAVAEAPHNVAAWEEMTEALRRLDADSTATGHAAQAGLAAATQSGEAKRERPKQPPR